MTGGTSPAPAGIKLGAGTVAPGKAAGRGVGCGPEAKLEAGRTVTTRTVALGATVTSGEAAGKGVGCGTEAKPEAGGTVATGTVMPGATVATPGEAPTGVEGQADIVRSDEAEPERFSCDKGRSGGADKASVDATDAGA